MKEGHKQYPIGQRVVAQFGSHSEHHGVIDRVNDEDQGDFEYHVIHDDGSDSFWAHEDLRPE